MSTPLALLTAAACQFVDGMEKDTRRESQAKKPRQSEGLQQQGFEDDDLSEVEIVFKPQTVPPVISEGISTPGPPDVLCGKGMSVYFHPGNVHFRELVEKFKSDYATCPNGPNDPIPKRIVSAIQSTIPPGRFLKQISTPKPNHNMQTGKMTFFEDNSSKLWYVMGTDEALEYTREYTRQAYQEGRSATHTPAKRNSSESSLPGSAVSDFATETQRKVFSTGGFVAKKLKRFQLDSPSLSSRKNLLRSADNASVVDLCSSDEEESECWGGQRKNVERKDPDSTEGKPPGSSAPFAKRAKTSPSTFHASGSTTKTMESKVESKDPLPTTTNISKAPGTSGKDTEYNKDSVICPTGFSLNGKSFSWRFYDNNVKYQRGTKTTSELDNAAETQDKDSYRANVLGTFSIERKRLLLDVLAPVTLPPEAMKIERWTSKDIDSTVVSKAFSQRFGSLPTSELAQLAKGDFLVPEGMVSVKETLRSHRLPPSEPTKPSVARIEEGSAKRGELKKAGTSEETSSTKKQVANNSFAWDGTIELVSKERATEKPSTDNSAAAATCDSESSNQSLLNDDGCFIMFNDNSFIEADSSVEDQPAPPFEENENEGNNKNETQFNKESVPNLPKNAAMDSTEVAVVPGSPNPTFGGHTETPHPEECENDGAAGNSKEVEEFIENTIVEYCGNQQSGGNPEGNLPDFQQARVPLSETVTNIFDMVTSRFQHFQESLPAEVQVDNLIEDKDNREPMSEASCDAEEGNENGANRPLIIVSVQQLFFLALPLICLAFILRRFGLVDVSNSIFECCFRTVVQLHVLGSMLSPIFQHGAERPVLVGCYALFMIVLASYEASSRTKYTHDGQFSIIAHSLVLSVGWVAMWAFGAILKPRPVWNPRYLLPIVGMLLGNSINGISSTLDAITTSLVEKQSEVDLYLSFGADQYEAVSGIVAQAIQKGMTPKLNMMCVVGIVSIPGMMTGQILGGSSPMVAARYQAMIIFLIVLSTLSTILVSSYLTVMSAFCSHQILRPDKFVQNRKRGVARLILWAWGYIFGGGEEQMSVVSNTATECLVGNLSPQKDFCIVGNLSPRKGFEIRSLKRGSVVLDGEGVNSLIQASGLNRYFFVEDDIDEWSQTKKQWNLFSDLSFSVNEGDLLLVSGPSGTGKSQLLRMMAGLSPLQEGDLWLQGKSWKDEYGVNNVVEWRRQVRYVTQTKVQIPGTPLQFIRKIQSFQSWTTDNERKEIDFMKHVSHHLREWGMGLDSLNKDWVVLSGGESQRVLMAIALASRPKILLFDESTSALDYESKIAVETSIKDFVADHEGGVMWVTHDEQQAERMKIY